ncbi:hypothetical protein GRI38_02065 [Altererythrobacter aurantiacus]|uniref:Hpr(Ser) kinase/phosphatase n=1 Tax=Parapontixanthobacter aurantiacus TaxID=1463599 RepID=A0A844ZGH3_9SPHN|nr:hypothetical protein [Parapontixanthobacter aurantiacus]MXO84819.1 hypothetical protein [Parapontixanthobacter aurantiacus]
MDARGYNYSHSGIVVASQTEFHEWETFRMEGSVHPDVSIEVRSPCAPLDIGAGLAPYGYRSDGDAFSFFVRGVARWNIEAGRQIVILPEQNADLRALRLYTLGSAWSVLGYQRRWLMWHGSAVTWASGAVLFCGGQGAGKSTFAAFASDRGHALVADDLSRIAWHAGPRSEPRIYRSTGQVKLWEPAIEHLGRQADIIERDLSRSTKFHCAPASLSGQNELPLHAIVILEWGESVSLSRLRGSEAVSAVLAQTSYRRPFLEAMSLLEQDTRAALPVIARVPVYRLRRPRDFNQIEAAYATLVAAIS